MSPTSPNPPAAEREAAFNGELQRRLEAQIGHLTVRLTAETLRADMAEADCRDLWAQLQPHLNAGPANTESENPGG